MADDFARIAPGDPISRLFRSSMWNRILDAVRYIEGMRGSGGALPSGRETGQTIRRIRNDSGEDRARGDVLGIDGFLYEPADSLNQFFREPTYIGSVPERPKHEGKFCILIEPCASGKIARAIFAGLAQVRLSASEGDKFADIIDGDATQLGAKVDGSTRIVATATSGDLATVVIGGAGEGGGVPRFAMLITDLIRGDTCEIREYTQNEEGEWCDTGESLTAYDPLKEMEGTANINGCQFVADPVKDGFAVLLRITCPNFACPLGQCEGT